MLRVAESGGVMSVDKLLVQLDGVHQSGHGRWSAKCPSHKDRTASLSVRELDDGQVLVHCFAGCSVQDVLGATGIDIAELFPERAPHHRKPERRPYPAIDALRAISFEVQIVLLSAADILAGKFSQSDRERLSVAVERIQSALSTCGVRYGH